MAAWFPYDVHILLITLLVIVWYYFKNVYRRFNESNIPFVEPWVPLGNITKSSLRFRHIVDDLHDAYKRFPDHKYFGFFQVNTSIIVLRDPEIIKQITVKDFEYFVNHQPFVNEDLDVLFGRNLFSLKGNKWRDMRSTLSPAFTGSKMKNMCNFMADVGRQVNQYLMAEIHKNNAGNEQSITLELKDLCTRYASDVIATTAFGVKVDSLHDKNNEFYVMGKKSSNFDGIVLLKFFLFAICPKIAAFFNVRLFSEEYCNFYRNLVQGTMEVREKEKIYRPDMIHLLMEAKKGTLKHEEQANEGKAGFATVEESSENIGITKRKWEDDDLTAQAVLFFLAGFETVANFMCFVLYELAVDTEIQKRLHDEIDTSIEENGDDLSYDIMQKLNYLDMIVSETLRKWPPSVVTDRVCSKDYNLAPSKEGSNDGIKLKRNDSLSLPIYSIHRDPTYWPNPDKFDPERFSEENKGNIQPYTFLPFGSGPRNCIGSRYALMEAKIMVYSLLSKFNIKLDEKRTPVPLELDLSSFNLKAKNGFWMTFLPRN